MVAPEPSPGVWAPERRRLTLGLVLTITLVAFESLAIATVMPRVEEDLGGLALYGWVFSGFFLAGLAGIVLTGVLIDRRGPVLPFSAGLVLFAAGLVVGGLAPSMPVLVAARLAQGFGAGAIPASAYASVARGYPAALRPRVFAVFSTAWVIPGLVGPSLAAEVERLASWRWVFLALLPLVVVAAVMALPALARLPRPAGVVPALDAADGARLRYAAVLVLGVGLVLAAATVRSPLVAVALGTAGLPLATAGFLRLAPTGTLRLAAGLPAVVAVRGILTWAFFGADAYVSLAVTEGRGGSTRLAGVTLTATAVLWSTGSWIQERRVARVGPRLLNRLGFALLAGATVGMLVVVLALPAWAAVPVWGVAGLAMGLAYPPLSVSALGAAAPGREGEATAALHLCDVLGTAVGTGVGGAAVALADARGWDVADGTVLPFALALAVALAGLAAAHRLPHQLPGA